ARRGQPAGPHRDGSHRGEHDQHDHQRGPGNDRRLAHGSIVQAGTDTRCRRLAAMRVLVVDNYDSFVYNLVQYLAQLGAEPVVLRNDEPALSAPDALAGYGGVLISPGPGTPERAGASIDLVKRCADVQLPLFGVCLGHQALGVAFGATVDRAPELMHGKTSPIEHTGAGVLAGLPSPFTATRYHSL